MKLQVIGCSHHDSTVEIRERMAFSENQIKPFLDLYNHQFPKSEAVLLSTCNRTEFYTCAANSEQLPSPTAMVHFLADQCGMAVQDIDHDLFRLSDRQAIKHLFTVAASLDSMVIGEAQILSQVKRAYQLAVESNPSSPVTHQVFQSAIRVARRVSNETEIHNNRVSVPSVAIGVLARQIFEGLKDKRILVIGAGEMGDETLNYIVADGGRDLVIVNRTRENAEGLADKFRGEVADWDQLEEQLGRADLVVSTTGARQPVVNRSMFEAAAAQRGGRPQLILDLAVPRDFDPEIVAPDHVFLYTLDDLQRECERNRKNRESQYPKALKIIDQELDRFFDDAQRRRSGSTIAQLKQQADQAKEAELERLLHRLEGLDAKQRKEIEQSFHRLVNKILHPPLKSLQSESSQSGGLLDALKKLFQLGD